MTDSVRHKGLIATAALLGGALTLTACGGGDGGDASGKDSGKDRARQADDAAAENASDARIQIQPKDGTTNTGINSDARVTVGNGTLSEVRMTAAGTNKPVAGTLSGDKKTWTPKGPLERSAKYTVTARATDSRGRQAVEHASFTTVSPKNSFIANYTPEDGSTVGVGMPVSVTFDKPVKNKKDVQAAIKVSADSNQKAVGHWFGDQRLDFRPREYWKAHSKVTVRLGLDGVRAAPDVKGVQDKTVTFTVGRSQVSTVDVRTHRMTVVRDGKELRTLPISAGSTEHPTYNGKMVVSERFRQTRMDGSTVGFTNNDGKGEYDIPDVPHAMRLSSSGTFIHGNYWGKGVFGAANTSHGCIGLRDTKGAGDSSTDGAWFYRQSMTGDVVRVVNSPDRTVKPDNGLNGWNMDWDRWVAGSALK
ncbi:Ig-like domain-containing protein [Streptomyces sp. MST-110588]|uniref:L,D-transpeptidase n=1 Tax=Streptomyces sp. MST-110588 TaxID=2833628 RepID=UPI001F5E163C|nr:Ig-like domain-containing protein [Streptomyces sp. MST-110588]UNO40202.1 L,D-transpeptidase family protein [Streptomyces sp. MST-110588]